MRKIFCVLSLMIFLLSLTAPITASAKAVLVIVGEKHVYEYSYPELCERLGGLSLNHTKEVLEEIALAEKVDPIDARLLRDKSGAVKVVGGKSGRAVDKGRLRSDILDALSVGGGIIKIYYKSVEPTFKSSDIERCKFLRASFRTYFSDNQSRVTNIARATELISGSVVGVNEIFSFNDAVGERTEKRGFKTAKIIVNGQFVEGVGGGVCQVSTTLYNAALLSGLECVEQHRHSLAVSYIEQSFDAMVNGSSSDLRFKNSTTMPIYIFGDVKQNFVEFYIYGEVNEYDIVRESVVLEQITPEVEKVETSELNVGESRVLVQPKCGYRSEGYLNIYRQGVLERRMKIRDDVYHAVNGVTEVGNNDAED